MFRRNHHGKFAFFFFFSSFHESKNAVSTTNGKRMEAEERRKKDRVPVNFVPVKRGETDETWPNWPAYCSSRGTESLNASMLK